MGSVAKGESSRCGGSGAKKRIFSGRCSTRGRDAGLDAATFNPGRWPVHGCKVGAVGKMPDARRFSAAVGNKGAREIVAVEKCAVSQSLGRLPVPMSNVRGLGSVFEAGRPWELDKRGTRTSRNIYIFVPPAILVVDARGVPYNRRVVNYQFEKCWVDPHFGYCCSLYKAQFWALFVEAGETD